MVPGLQQFNTNVGIKFQLYNSLFFHFLCLFTGLKNRVITFCFINECEEGFKRKKPL